MSRFYLKAPLQHLTDPQTQELQSLWSVELRLREVGKIAFYNYTAHIANVQKDCKYK